MLVCITPSLARAQNRDGVSTSRDGGIVRIPLVDQQDVRFKRLSTVDGLSQTMVTSILQDDQGFIWFGTQYGLNRYDGYKFKVFKHDPGLPDSLSGVYVLALFKDRSGKIWIANDRVHGSIRPGHRNVHSLSCRFPRIRRSCRSGVTHMSQDRIGMLWVATRPMACADWIRHRVGLLAYRHDPDNPSSLRSNTDQVERRR